MSNKPIKVPARIRFNEKQMASREQIANRSLVRGAVFSVASTASMLQIAPALKAGRPLLAAAALGAAIPAGLTGGVLLGLGAAVKGSNAVAKRNDGIKPGHMQALGITGLVGGLAAGLRISSFGARMATKAAMGARSATQAFRKAKDAKAAAAGAVGAAKSVSGTLHKASGEKVRFVRIRGRIIPIRKQLK